MVTHNNFATLLSRSSCIFFTLVVLVTRPVTSETVQLESDSINNILSTHEIVFVNFYADWCRFSQILKPVFEETAVKVKEAFPEAGKVAFGMVDCDKQNGIATQYHISKYPTLKLFRNGQMVKTEYRGQRSVDSLTKYISNQVADPVEKYDNLEDLGKVDEKKRNVIGYFEGVETQNYKTYRRVATVLRDDCKFHAAIGDVSAAQRSETGDKLHFQTPMTKEAKDYEGDISSYDDLLVWAQGKCVPIVREITFENAEELTEEGLPFLILFHKLDDTDIVEKFTRSVTQNLMEEKNSVNFLTADGTKFSHPLHHLGKSVNDLPVLAIDSFRHMYIFKHDVRDNIENAELLKQFVADLHSGKLHREFHHGAETNQIANQQQGADPKQPYPVPPIQVDATTPYPIPPLEKDDSNSDDSKDDSDSGANPDLAGAQEHLPHDKQDADPIPDSSQQPPESSFKNLQPSRTRYTILKEEL